MSRTVCGGDSNHTVAVGWLVAVAIEIAAVVTSGYDDDRTGKVDLIDHTLVS